MNRTDIIRLPGFSPTDKFASRISLRGYGLKVAGPAGYARMSVMNQFFIMGKVALLAFRQRLIAMAEFCRPGMADHAGDIRVGC